jgi:predicted neuraminidase
MMKNSSDGGLTWSEPVRLPEGVIGPVKNKPLEFENGELLCPSSTEDHGWQVWFERTSDRGASWSRIGPLNDTAAVEAIQPSILRRSGRWLQAVGRTKQDRMFSMESTDGGETWTRMQLLDFWCSNSGLDGVVLKDGRMLVVYNHARNTAGKWSAGREMLNVAVSLDGKEWERGCVLEREEGEEFSYPSIIQTDDGLVHITYTWKRQRIRHVVLDPSRIEPSPFRGLAWE